MTNYYTEAASFYGSRTPESLLSEFGSPLYVYNESILRERCREMVNLITDVPFQMNYSIKANSNLELLKIIRQEGSWADAMSPGEIHILLEAGFKPEEIFYVGNNVSRDEMLYAIEKGVMVSVDSISQLVQFGNVNPGGKVSVRFNPGVGAGHHEKVVTGGDKTKFGVNVEYISEMKEILKKYNLKLIGINQHIGSLFMDGENYIQGVKALLSVADKFDDLEFVDFGGGFGIPYHKQDGEQRLELKEFQKKINNILFQWAVENNRNVTFKIEPGRYIAAECGVLLGTVYALKQNALTRYAGSDIGFNTLIRPAMYDSWHDIEVYKKDGCADNAVNEKVTVVGNICETGDILAKERMLPSLAEGDILAVIDAGAYGYSMCSNYNGRLRPAEVLIGLDGNARLIRRRDSFEDLMRNFVYERS